MTVEASTVSETTKQDAGVLGSCVQRKFVPAPIWTEAMLAALQSNAIKLSRSLGRPKLSWRMNQKLVPTIFILTVAATHQPLSCYNIN